MNKKRLQIDQLEDKLNYFDKAGNSRTVYLRAVKASDQGDYTPLLIFARS